MKSIFVVLVSSLIFYIIYGNPFNIGTFSLESYDLLFAVDWSGIDIRIQRMTMGIRYRTAERNYKKLT